MVLEIWPLSDWQRVISTVIWSHRASLTYITFLNTEGNKSACIHTDWSQMGVREMPREETRSLRLNGSIFLDRNVGSTWEAEDVFTCFKRKPSPAPEYCWDSCMEAHVLRGSWLHEYWISDTQFSISRRNWILPACKRSCWECNTSALTWQRLCGCTTADQTQHIFIYIYKKQRKKWRYQGTKQITLRKC